MSESDENNIKINYLNLKDDGLKIIKNFFSLEEISLLKKELNHLFLMPSFNGSSGCCILKKNLFVNYRCINLPTATIRTVNLLEKACEIREYISKEIDLPKQEIKLTALEIFEEKNEIPLFWHTDNMNGAFRAFIYPKRGEIDSGAFTYMLGTHRRKENIEEHKLDKLKIKENKNTIFTANSGLGSLVIANINGFHSNTPRKKLED